MSTAPIVGTSDLTAYQAGDADALLAQVTAAVRRTCGWHVAPSKDDTFTWTGPWNMLLLPSLHVTAVASVTLNSTVLDPSMYIWKPNGVLQRPGFQDGGYDNYFFDSPGSTFLDFGWWQWLGNDVTTVEFTHGFDLVDVPDLAQAILAQVTRIQSNPTRAMAVQTGPFREQFGADNDEFDDVLEHYTLTKRP